jgi:hypothetical protein
MILLYTLLLFLLGVATFLIGLRVRRLEKKYYRAATQADQLLRGTSLRPGNGNRLDPYESAKRQYQLGLLVQKRDRLEGKFDAWQKLAKRAGNLAAAVRSWKGRKLPYTFGVLDVSAVLYLIDEMSVGQYVSIKPLVEMIVALLPK